MKFKHLFLFFIAAIFAAIIYSSCNQNNTAINNGTAIKVDSIWHAPDSGSWASEPNFKLIEFGQMLVVNTAEYLGPNGSIENSSNGMNCDNCHQQAGTKTFGNNFGAVAATYPTFRPRSGKVENIYQRINECMQRSLNGQALDTDKLPIMAMAAYIMWVGKKVPKGKIPHGAGAGELAYIDRAADTMKGEAIYTKKCSVCHGINGAGLANTNGTGYQYPPLWGKHSYNTGASMSRIGKLATYIRNNMPYGVTYDAPQLKNEEAWDVAAFIDSKPRPIFNDRADWPDLKNKPIDYPTGPYADEFSQQQHKYGPYKSIIEAKKQQNKKA